NAALGSVAAKYMRHFVNGCFQWVSGYWIDGNRSALAVSLAVAVNHFKGSFFDVQRVKGFRSVPRIGYSIRLVFSALSLRQNKPTRLPQKERVMFRRFFAACFILGGFLSSDRHAKPDCLFSAFNVAALVVPVFQRGNRPYWNLAQRALNQRGKLIAD